MKKTKDRKRNSEPKYLKLYTELKRRILEKRVREGEKLPSKRQLADDFAVSVITAEHALELLDDEGYIEARERSGYYVIYREGESFEVGNADQIQKSERNNISEVFEKRRSEGQRTKVLQEEVRRKKTGHETPENRTGNEEKRRGAENEQNREAPEIGFSFPLYARIMRKVISEYGEEILVKSPNNGCFKLRKAIADYLYASRGMQVNPEQIVIGSGAEYLYGILVPLLGRDLTYGIENPSYEKIEQVYRANGVRLVRLSLGRNGIRSEALRENEFDVLHISPYRSYPSGVSADVSKRREYLRWVNGKEGRFIIEDDFESEFYPAAKPMETLYSAANGTASPNLGDMDRLGSSGGKTAEVCRETATATTSPTELLSECLPEKGGLGSKDRVIYLNTFSRTVSPSIRTGYMVLPESLLGLYGERVGFYSCAVPTFEQYFLAELIESGEFVRIINRIRRKKRMGENR